MNFFSGEKLLLNGTVITNAMNQEEGLKSFMDFLKNIVTGGTNNEECILVAHNGARYDHTVLKNNLKRYRIPLPSFVCFADSMTLMKAYKRKIYLFPVLTTLFQSTSFTNFTCKRPVI